MINRRRFLMAGAAAIAGTGLWLSSPSRAHAWAEAAPERKLSLYNLHTHEAVDVVYWAQGEYLPENLRAINYLMRDHRSGDVAMIDQRLLNYLFRISAALELREPFQVVSGYRSPGTNDELHRKDGAGVAQHSLHMRGMAVDICLEGTALPHLRAAARAASAGGVGYYPDRFIHIDVGPVRHWAGKA